MNKRLIIILFILGIIFGGGCINNSKIKSKDIESISTNIKDKDLNLDSISFRVDKVGGRVELLTLKFPLGRNNIELGLDSLKSSGFNWSSRSIFENNHSNAKSSIVIIEFLDPYKHKEELKYSILTTFGYSLKSDIRSTENSMPHIFFGTFIGKVENDSKIYTLFEFNDDLDDKGYKGSTTKMDTITKEFRLRFKNGVITESFMVDKVDDKKKQESSGICRENDCFGIDAHADTICSDSNASCKGDAEAIVEIQKVVIKKIN